jgi:multidrug efflux pump subunit AcrA (membrane-fusion protein)
VITDVAVKPGELVTTAPVVGVIDMSAFTVEITVDEVDVAKVVIGQVVDVFVDALGAPVLAGEVVRVSPRAESDQGVVSYKVTVEVTPDTRNVKAGMTASAQIITGEAKGVVAVPRTAVTSMDGVHTVTLIKGAEQVSQPVELGVVGDDMVEIRSGLKSGDIIAVAGGTSK